MVENDYQIYGFGTLAKKKSIPQVDKSDSSAPTCSAAVHDLVDQILILLI